MVAPSWERFIWPCCEQRTATVLDAMDGSGEADQLPDEDAGKADPTHDSFRRSTSSNRSCTSNEEGEEEEDDEEDSCIVQQRATTSSAPMERLAPRPPGLSSLTRSTGGALVTLHIYDVFGYSAVKHLNRIVALFGTGAFHSAVEVFGLEYSYGFMDDPPGTTGVYSCEPGKCEAHSYREQLLMGQTNYCQLEVEALLEDLKQEWLGQEYDLLRRNCCHFSDAFCRRLGVGGIPTWVNNLAAAGATLGNGFRQFKKPKDRIRHSQQIIAAAKAGRVDKRYSTVGTVAAPGKAMMSAMTETRAGSATSVISFLREDKKDRRREADEEVVQTPHGTKVCCMGRLCGGVKRPATK